MPMIAERTMTLWDVHTVLREPGMWSTGDPAPYLKSPNALQNVTMHPGSPKALKGYML